MCTKGYVVLNNGSETTIICQSIMMLLQAFDGMPRITKPSRRCPAWTTPSPSQRLMEPPRSESREDREKGRKSMVVTLILSENCILITEP